MKKRFLIKLNFNIQDFTFFVEDLSSIYYFEKSGAGRFPSLKPDSIDDFRQTSANAVDGEVRKKRKDVT